MHGSGHGNRKSRKTANRNDETCYRIQCPVVFYACGFVPIHNILTHTMDRMTSLQTKGETVTGLSTGFADLDRLTTGLHQSDFIILAARPSMGKTALALNIAQNVALRGAKEKEAPKRVAFFSLEMRGDQLVQRMLCTEADTDIKKLAAGFGTEETWPSKGQLPCPMEPIVGSRRQIR